jgi:FkbM family methyltransferase
MKYLVKKIIPPAWRPGIRTVLDRVRGLRTTQITHREIARHIARRDPVILEIGCNDGSDTVALMNAMPKARIYCFEPDTRAIARFKKRLGVDLNRVTLVESAVSDRNGQIDFYASNGSAELGEDWDLSGSIRRPKNHLIANTQVKFDRVVTINTCRLDDWCTRNGIDHVDFIWMDVQGAEADVIAGAANILNRTRFLYTEYSNDELYEGQIPLKELLARLPLFNVIARFPGDILLRNGVL